MKRKTRLQPVSLLIAIGFLLAALAVGTAGYLAYTSVERLTHTLQESARPNRQLEAVQAVITAITHAESSVRTFAITQDEQSLEPYYQVVSEIDEQLYDLSDASGQEARISRIASLIEEKFVLMDSTIEVISQGTEPSAFERLYAEVLAANDRAEAAARPELEPVSPDSSFSPAENPGSTQPPDSVALVATNAPPEAEKPPKRSILQRIFGRKNKKKKEETTENQPAQPIQQETTIATEQPEGEDAGATEKPAQKLQPKPRSQELLALIQRSARKISADEAEQLNAEAQVVRRLTRQDMLIMGRIMEQLNRMRAEQQMIAKSRADQASQETEKTTRLVAVFSISTLVVFLLLLIFIFRDLSRTQKLQRNLRAEKARAEGLAKTKEDFLSNMSHEIRTPMGAIIGFTEQLASTPLNARQKSFVRNVSLSADHLLALINDVLDFSKLDSGKFSLERISFRLSDLIDEVATIFQPKAQAKGLRLFSEKSSDLPPVLLGDPLRLRQMLFNLVNNAIKFTEAGHVCIRAEAEVLSEKEYLIRLTVADTGIGIPPEQQGKIFVDFEQADTSTTRRYGGTGLGLSITKKLTELHGGRISLESEVGKGTEIILELPYLLGDARDLPLRDRSLPAQRDALRGLRALVADDEPYNRLLVETLFEKWGVEGDFVENGKQALDKLGEKTYDLILLDFQMPVMGGLEATRQIRKAKWGSGLPIVGLTATSTPSDLQQSLDVGMNANLLKPFKEPELYQLLVDLLGKEGAHPTGNPPAESTPTNGQEGASAPPEDRYDLQELFEMGQGEEAFVHRMLKLFVENTRNHLAVMRKAAEQEDWETIGFNAHKIVPPARHLGLKGLVRELKKIELDVKEGHALHTLPERVTATGDKLEKVIKTVELDMQRLE
jgi:signal transduction histidine kinase/DNA-binding response OmpR family regulator